MVHSVATIIASKIIFKTHKSTSKFRRILHVDLIVVIILGATILEGILWAIFYLHREAFETLEQALYFSLVTYTTLGYGDLVLQDAYRLIGAIEAANGLIMFGWSTAIVVFAIQKIYF